MLVGVVRGSWALCSRSPAGRCCSARESLRKLCRGAEVEEQSLKLDSGLKSNTVQLRMQH